MDTTELQRRLLALGYYLGTSGPKGDGVDGDFGRLTRTALIKFQADRKLDLKYPGTIGPKTRAALGVTEDAPSATAVPPWIELAQRKMGLHEVRDNRALKEFLKSDGSTLGDPAKLPWCGDFIETCVAVTLPGEPMIANPYWALNWLKFGVEVPKDAPVLGAIGAAERNGGGHVFFVVGHDRDNYHALGGNQSDGVSIVKMPKGRVKGLRYPRTYPLPPKALAMTTFNGMVSTKEV